ncbi:hypothetical protein HER18_07675 [Chryseobacterium sp. NEB161]|nr:hypothetical protein HER18_07675 [Chryseobacterium sp. NEB161]
MNNISFNQDGGFRLSTNILAAVQASYTLFNALGWIGGDLTIISGCEVNGSTVSDGVVFINGEVFNFKGGDLGTYVIIRETVTSYPFQNGTVKPVIRERYVSFGSGTPDQNFLWADFKRLFPTKDIEAFKTEHDNRIEALEGKQAFAIGMILRYDQPLSVAPPAGWVDWNPAGEQGRVWVSRSETDGDFGLGSTGGEKTHQLIENEMPAHKHNYTDVSNNMFGGPDQSTGFDGGNVRFKLRTVETESKGGNQAHNNLQPYVAVRFIKYVGI